MANSLRDTFSGITPEGECGDVFARTGRMPPGGCGNVYTYFGYKLDLLGTDGSWDMATYDCDYDHDTGQIVDVRAARGALP